MTGIFIVARLGSTRLSRKHLIQTAGKSFIEWLVYRFYFAFQAEIENKDVQLFIVTSDKEENKEFESLFEKYSFVQIFYGADSNIPLRELQCATANRISEIINIDGDDILCSVTAVRAIMKELLSGQSYVKTTGLPLGMNVMGFTTTFLKESLSKQNHSVLETGWGKIFDENRLDDIRMGEYDSDKRLRLTLDYEDDAKFFDQIIKHFENKIIEVDDLQLINYIIENRMFEINQGLNSKYWENFELQKAKE